MEALSSGVPLGVSGFNRRGQRVQLVRDLDPTDPSHEPQRADKTSYPVAGTNDGTRLARLPRYELGVQVMFY